MRLMKVVDEYDNPEGLKFFHSYSFYTNTDLLKEHNYGTKNRDHLI